ncbi:ribonuclease III domain-containing protein [Microdochium trichocladiopsis]|uniref:Large ribosomal subunit protein mL44 n=1 Tax=Microdochium trichocladiopsis TaxID=1682393 RepID=A0A9P8Y9M4_9PEZI|nr:ribonuclease III domain-containing protein [Microdochium trichocladiopsis]KAH7031230.1 ribonuclease III domain-containing protein [Microdochium trichocladiopsis]
MPAMTPMKTKVLAFQFEGCAYQPPAGDQTCLGYLRRRTIALATARCQSTEAIQIESTGTTSVPEAALPQSLPSPHPDRALRSAKLAALHARLYLSSKVPLQTLARCLVDPSADAHPKFNNANLAFLGSTILQYHTSEWLIAHYPRLPMAILFAAMKGYAGVPALHQIGRAWGVEQAYAPGGEVDPGLLQFTDKKPTVVMNRWGYVRAEAKELQKYKWRRGMSSRVLYDDAFGEVVAEEQPETPVENQGLEVSSAKNTKDVLVEDPAKNAHANMVRAVIGAIYLHHGRDAAHDFVKAHVLSRRLDLSNLFEFKLPTRELARLCAREDFEAPVARLLNETGRMSRTPVFVVGIFSGRDKLGEGTGPSLDSARVAASINALKSWYLYSPGDRVPVPSDTFLEDAAPWKPAYVDIGEIIS